MLDPLYPAARQIARYLKTNMAFMLPYLKKQVSYTGIMQYHTNKAIFELPIKGRPDFIKPDEFIVDLKVTDEINVDAIAARFGYENQQFGYGKLGNCKTAYLLFYRKAKKDIVCKRLSFNDNNEWWKEKIIKFGKAI